MQKRHPRISGILFIFLFFSSFLSTAQSYQSGYLKLEGAVYGYTNDPSKKFLKADKQVKIEGVLDQVVLKIFDGSQQISSANSNARGNFSVKFKLGKIYRLQYSKDNYAATSLQIDLRDVPAEIAKQGLVFVDAELLLNSYQMKGNESDVPDFGRLFYSAEKNYLDFEVIDQKSKKLNNYYSNPASLLERSVEKNRGNRAPANSVEQPDKNATAETVQKDISSLPPKANYLDTVSSVFSKLKQKVNGDLEKLSTEDLNDLEESLAAAKKEYENQVNSGASQNELREQKQQIEEIETKLKDAKKLIEAQQQQISTQQRFLISAVVGVVLLLTLLFVIVRFSKERKKTLELLRDKNKKITDSINYALRIQQSILPSQAEINKLIPASFVFFQPRDIVSGDFYWLSEVDEKVVIACVDCTGHGIPGAFMSLIGNTLLNEIVNERELTDPAKILEKLDQEVVKALHQNQAENQSKDGMEMSICVLDKRTGNLQFCGAMNGAYLLKKSGLHYLQPAVRSIGGSVKQGKEIAFETQTLPIEKGSKLYLFTDGYMDQFGGPNNKKYNLANFKNLLTEIHNDTMEDQRKKVETSIQQWKGGGKQIDDMLIIGIEL